MAYMVYVVIADGEIDLIHEATRKQNQAHVNDLRNMGCKVESHRFCDWPTAQQYADEYEIRTSRRR